MKAFCISCNREHEVPGPCPALERDPLLIEREKTHGSFTKTAEIAQQLKKIVHIHSSPEIKIAQVEALSMICTKIARILSGNPNEKEHYLDIAGYAKLGAEACDNG